MTRTSRGQMLKWSALTLGSIALGGAGGFEILSQIPSSGPLSGRFPNTCPQVDRLVMGTFFSKARNRRVGYSIGYPPRCSAHSHLPLIIFLHGYGGSHRTLIGGMEPDQAAAVQFKGKTIPRVAIVTVDGGNDYWHGHPGDNAMEMVVHELIPRCQSIGLGTGQKGIGVLGLSMGGYGALLMAEDHPRLLGAVAVISQPFGPRTQMLYGPIHTPGLRPQTSPRTT